MNTFIPRSLNVLLETEERRLRSADLLDAEELRDRPIIILGEPGSGKTELIKWLAATRQPDQTPVSARRLVRDADAIAQDAGLVFVDGLDEVAALQEGDGLHDVLEKLRTRGVRRFVVACRAAEWRSASARGIFQEWNLPAPVEAVINPFSLTEAETLLAQNAGLGTARAAEIVAGYRSRGLSEWLGNPLTLKMLATVATDGTPPSTSRQLFEQFVEQSWKEWRKQSQAHQTLTPDTCLNGLGAMFAGLILGGHRAISLAPAGRVDPEDLRLGDVRELPSLAELSDKQLLAILDNRLVLSIGSDRFTYMHRRIGEYLGARWLARLVDTRRKRRRLLSVFQSTGGIVPASLRGMFGLLALDPQLASDVIRTDPMAVILYGDADGLSLADAKALLLALIDCSCRNPWFRSGDRLNARSLVQPGMEDVARRVLGDESNEGTVRLTVAEQLTDAGSLSEYKPILEQWLTDESVPWRLRDEAAGILLVRSTDIDWPRILGELSGSSSNDSLRLALTIAAERKCAGIDDASLAKMVFDRHDAAPDEIAKYWRLERCVPDDRLDGLLDALTAEARRRLTDESGFETSDLQRLTIGLIVRRLKLGEPVGAARLWAWVSAFPQHSRTASRDDELAEILTERDELRRAIQRHVLFGSGADLDLFWPWCELRERLPGCDLTEDDIVYHLNELPVGDPRWWSLVTFAGHGPDKGAVVRQAALLHAATEEDRARLEELAAPRRPQWEIEEEKRESQRSKAREARWEAHRKFYHEHRGRLRAGDQTVLVGPADVYVGWATAEVDDLPPHPRIETWLGPELAADVFAGFDAWLENSSAELTPRQIAETYAAGERLRAGAILIAALAERNRRGCRFVDLDDGRILAAMLEFKLGLYEQTAVKELGKALEGEVRERGLYQRFARDLVEPQLRARKGYPTGLYELARDERNLATGATLAEEWLQSIPDLHLAAEAELIDCLLRAGKTEILKLLAEGRLAMANLPVERRRNWQAVALIVDFDSVVSNVGSELSEDPNALWILRDRLGSRWRREPLPAPDDPRLFAWIVSAFRARWPYVEHPAGVTSGNTNPWDASEFLLGLINALAADPSDAATAALRDLASVEDGYKSYIRNVVAQQADLRAERDFRPVSIPELRAVLTDGPPATPKDLQACVVDALNLVQEQIRSNSTDSWRRFYREPDKRVPQSEDDCTDYLAELLSAAELIVRFERETHLGNDRETDIWCSVNGVSIPIEAKGQWHQRLWTAPDDQLAQQQASDHRADGYGIYLVYWFGNAGKKLKSPPKGSGIEPPTSPEELAVALQRFSPALRSGRLRVFLLDLSRPLA